MSSPLKIHCNMSKKFIATFSQWPNKKYIYYTNYIFWNICFNLVKIVHLISFLLLTNFLVLTKRRVREPSCLAFSGKELLLRTYPGNTEFECRGNNIWSMRMPLRTSWISLTIDGSETGTKIQKKKRRVRACLFIF